jgi:acid phosphatase family membrane protein YuiD
MMQKVFWGSIAFWALALLLDRPFLSAFFVITAWAALIINCFVSELRKIAMEHAKLINQHKSDMTEKQGE